MQGRKIAPLIILLLFTSRFAFCQSETIKPVVNSLALYKKTKDLKFLGNAKKSIDSLITTHDDSLDMEKVVYRAVVNSGILYIDSLNTLKQPANLFDQTVSLTDILLAKRKIYRFADEMAYVKNCLANVYIRKGFAYINVSDYVNAESAFISAQKYAPSFKYLKFYIAYSNNKLGKLKDAAKYYTDLLHTDSTNTEYIQTAANIYKLMGDTAKSLEIIKQGRKSLPEDKILLLDEANIYNNSRDYQSLEPLLSPLLELFSNNEDIIFVAANCYDHLDKYDQAEQLYLRAIDINSAAYDPVFNLGLLYFKESLLRQGQGKEKDTQLAVQLLEKANEISPNDIKGLKVLQLVYTETQNKSQLNKVNSKIKQLTNQ